MHLSNFYDYLSKEKNYSSNTVIAYKKDVETFQDFCSLKFKLDDLLIGDKNALMVGTRVLGYGKEYNIKITDPDTGLEVEGIKKMDEIGTEKEKDILTT